MSDTPRTEVYVLDPLPQVVSADWARQLERELNAAKARIARLEEAGGNMLEALYTPEPPRCVCHRSPPCDDCVNYALARDAKQKWQQAKETKP